MESDALCFDHGLSYFVYLPRFRRLRYLASRLLLSCAIFYPALWHLPRQRMVVDLFSQLIVYRARCVHCQLSRLISHSTQGIIMGFPTTVSMTLVCTNPDPSLLQLSNVPGNDRWVGRPVSTRQVRGLGSRARRRHVHRCSRMDSLGIACYHVCG